jgi:hypothetical protein
MTIMMNMQSFLLDLTIEGFALRMARGQLGIFHAGRF